MKTIIQNAAYNRLRHFELGRPMTSVSEGFKEANIAHDLSAAFRDAGYFVYPEFPFEGGSIDAVFVSQEEIVLCEWKRCYAGSTESIAAQTQRMLRFIPDIELPKHGFSTKNWRIGFLWVCDVWDDLTKDWWHGHRPSTIVTPCPFDPTWSRGEYSFNGLKWSYAWIWAYKYK